MKNENENKISSHFILNMQNSNTILSLHDNDTIFGSSWFTQIICICLSNALSVINLPDELAFFIKQNSVSDKWHAGKSALY